MKCWITLSEFVAAIGIVNADVRMTKTTVCYATKYRLVAERIESLGRGAGARVLKTVTDEGMYVVSVKGLRSGWTQ